ncbi:PTS beta-glucoside transporter subunit EIIBCA [Corynebacterium poyangense]|uniref:PTS beta-glucoside transporter subunit EIIBCA n=1 Tax=Corynebacterium poyangense TaxID=2684405 RepID=A0A7H0SNL7_9CORY|nr:glucose PTS transporter subunit IIA [Corynebacterium poyangense]QNQ90142.1 PTS beta-glucoside transporter subunit EIIBCA [Corynebacterium poyangense]
MASTTTTSQHILDNIGGPGNITSMTHCATRLRFQLADQSRVDIPALESDPAVLGVVKQGSTGLQVIMGGGVAEYYQGIKALPGMSGHGGEDSAQSGKKNYGGVRGKYGWVDYCFEVLSDTFRPILWALLGASLIITLLVLLDTFGVQDFRQEMTEQPPTFQFLHAMWKSVFYFLPIMVGATASRKLGANEWVGAAVPAALLTPTFIDMQKSAVEVSTSISDKSAYLTHVFGLPMYINDYSGQVFPPLFAAVVLYFVEKGLKKIIPGAIQMVFVPFFSLAIMIPLTAFVVGPFGLQVGNWIANFLFFLNETSPFILAVVIPLLYPFLVPLGLHWPLNAIMIVNLNTLQYDFIQGPMGAWNFACFGVITGVFILSLKEKNTQMRQVSAGGMFAGLLGGISEPSLYGVLLRYRRSYYRLLPGCLIGGIVMGIFNVKAYAFVFTSLLTVVAMKPVLGYCIGIAAAFFSSLLLTLFLDYRTKEEKAEMQARIAAEREAANEAEDERIAAIEDRNAAPVVAGGAGVATATATQTKPVAQTKPVKEALQPGTQTSVGAPLEGEAVELSEVPDPAFAQGALGQGIAIKPTGNTVVAPADGTIIAAQKTGHAVGLRLDSGIDMLIHIGIDTVQMQGDGFEVHVERKQHVKAGDKLITFDRDKIHAAGYSDITPVLISNTKKFAKVESYPASSVSIGQEVIKVYAKDGE